MASGTLEFLPRVKVSSFKLGQPSTGGASPYDATLTYSDPTGYHRYVADVHIQDTTSGAYMFNGLMYGVNDANRSVSIRYSRGTTTGSPAPITYALAVDIPNNSPIKASYINLGNISVDGNQATGTKTWTNPSGYKRYIVGPHLPYSTNSNSTTFYQLLYTIDYGARSITVTINRNTTSGSPNPHIDCLAIDVPEWME